MKAEPQHFALPHAFSADGDYDPNTDPRDASLLQQANKHKEGSSSATGDGLDKLRNMMESGRKQHDFEPPEL